MHTKEEYSDQQISTNKKKCSHKYTKEFLAYSDDEIQKAYQQQLQENKMWTFDNERVISEQLLSDRFNYLILIYTLFGTVIAMTYDKITPLASLIISSIAAVLITCISMIINRLYHKVNINIEILYKIGDIHPFHFIRKESLKRSHPHRYANKLIGVFVPWFCSMTTYIGVIFSLYSLILSLI